VNNGINIHHHRWYNGGWHGYWNSRWYAPVAWFSAGWGLGAWTSGWGTVPAFYNPYFSNPAVVQSSAFDYSQPVVVNNYTITDNSASSSASGGAVANDAQAAAREASLTLFDEGLAKFESGDYHAALAKFNEVLKERPGDAVVHEVRSLALFALGDYQAAAAGLNSLLSAAPGMDWTTMSGLYGDPEDYTRQLRRLEEFAGAHPDDAAAHFVLAYHYLVLGSKEAAIDALRIVVEIQPRDVTARRMLDALAPPKDDSAEKAPAEPAPSERPPTPESKTGTGEEIEALQTDLVGVWKASVGDTVIELSISEESDFSWVASSPGEEPTKLEGVLTAGAGGIQLKSPEQGALGGAVTSKGPDAWLFKIDGTPPQESGLSFVRVN
jgi:tetratricopeptide (TPR) repeat protein